MLIFLFLFLSYFQVGALGIGGNVGAQALLEHEAITLHHWLTPAQLSDLMAFCRTLPGGTGINAATLSGYLATAGKFGFWGCAGASVVAVAGLAIPSALWTELICRCRQSGPIVRLTDSVMPLLRPLIPGLVIGAALLMMRSETMGSMATTPWHFWISCLLCLATLVGTGIYRVNGTFMVVLCGIAGWLLL